MTPLIQFYAIFRIRIQSLQQFRLLEIIGAGQRVRVDVGELDYRIGNGESASKRNSIKNDGRKRKKREENGKSIQFY